MREKFEAIRRARKQARREGLIADPRKKNLLTARAGFFSNVHEDGVRWMSF